MGRGGGHVESDRWVHVSTVSVYEEWPHQPITEASSVLDCPPDADESFGHTGPDGSPTVYGFQKAGAERAVEQGFGDRCVFLRPGVILGREEYVGRLPWWLARTAKGGRVLAPAPADRHIQPVDVRDVAAFAVDQAALPPPAGRTTSRTPRASPSRASSTRASPPPEEPAGRCGRSPSCSPSTT